MTFVRLLGELVPTGSSLRTSEDYLVQTVGTLWPESLRDWPQTGSLHAGRVYEHQTLERPTDDCDGSALPTPTASDGTKAVGTPENSERRRAAGRQAYLTDIVQTDLQAPTPAALLPTPTVVDMGARKTVEEWEVWTLAMKDRHGSGNGHGKSLSIEARLLPTPTCLDKNDARKTDKWKGDNLAATVKELPTQPGGESTQLLSPDGSKPLAGLRPTPLTTDAD